MQAQAALERESLERRLMILGTIGNDAPFVGLLGTVIGVVHTLDELGQSAAVGQQQSAAVSERHAFAVTAKSSRLRRVHRNVGAQALTIRYQYRYHEMGQSAGSSLVQRTTRASDKVLGRREFAADSRQPRRKRTAVSSRDSRLWTLDCGRSRRLCRDPERTTRQKQAVQAVFAAAKGPLGPHEVAVAARELVPSLGIATAYRSIKELVDAGWLVSVATPAGARFETAARGHHHHFFCSACTKTFDIDGCVGGFDRLLPAGFLAEQHELTITGKCKSCAGRTDEVPRVT